MQPAQFGLLLAATVLSLAPVSRAATHAPSAAGEQRLSSHLKGRFTFTVIEEVAGGFRVRAQVLEPSLVHLPAGGDSLRPWVGQPFFFTVSDRGELRDFRFAAGMPGDARTLLQSVASSLQAVQPQGRGTAWATEERDASGVYSATYETEGDTLVRTKGGYVQPKGVAGISALDPRQKFDVRARARLTLTKDGFPASVDSSETFDVSLVGVRISATSKVSAKLDAIDFRPELVGAMPDTGFETEDESDVRTAGEHRRKLDTERVAGRTFADLIAGLNGPAKEVRDDAQFAMAALLRLDPSLVPDAAIAVQQSRLDGIGRQRLVSAIASSDAAGSQAALVSILEGTDAERRHDAAVRLGLLPRPSAAAAEALLRHLNGADEALAATVGFAAGNMAHRLQKEGLPVGHASQLVDALAARLQAARTTAQRQDALEALGNAGLPAITDLVTPFLADKEPSVRASAVGALRHLPGDAIDARIAAAFDDAHARVRRAAVQTLSHRPVDGLLPAVQGLLAREKSEQVRVGTVQSLGAKVKASPAVARLFGEIARNPADAAGQLAKKVLAGPTL